ncbi:MAG: uncharacterized protein PWP31_1044 [Clostridia bacterium]|nr:uncharacterized protein [Clostridia bacterium]
MKIGIISDTHGDVLAWKQVLSTCFQGVDMIIHAGDVLYHGPRNPILADYAPKDLSEVIKECDIPILIARGNCDAEVDSMVLNMSLQDQVVLQMGKHRIVAQHGHRLQESDMEPLAEYYKADLWITGHTHVPLLSTKGQRIFLNPGSPSLPKNGPLGNKKTVAIADDFGVKILDISNGETITESPWLTK